MSESPGLGRCPRCGADVSLENLDGLCPACLMAAGALSHSIGTVTSGSEQGGTRSAPFRLAAGESFGRYRIERPLGRGGMGEVYAAEHLDSSRRIALKVLSQALGDSRDRARFLREGQLAASISHPNSVYVFGSEEIEGVPAISMELLPGGTLKDRVKANGPLPIADAVDAILQVIAGLDAAAAAGVLHRDIKPGNCFIDADGTVKVGDFGLSVSTLARDAAQPAMSGGFRGTPQFASPEQLKGAPLDVSSDIYAVGATLYYLLTGRPPFDESDVPSLVSRMSAEAPMPVSKRRPEVPRSLSRIVMRCLAHESRARPSSYAVLARELQPYASGAAAPATLPLRFVAGFTDATILFMLGMVGMAVHVSVQQTTGLPRALPSWTGPFVTLLYFSIGEGLFGRSLGKQIFGLRVVGVDGRPGIGPRAIGRAAIYCLPDVLFKVLSATYPTAVWWPTILDLGLLAAIFATATRSNGWAAIHDLVTRTRVVTRTVDQSRQAASSFERLEPAALREMLGPYEVTGSLGRTDSGELLAAFDPGLRRQIWIHRLLVDSPPVPVERRNLGRSTRLRWLSETRNSVEAWDAYDAPRGTPLYLATRQPRTWKAIKRWLLDLSDEARAGGQDDSNLVLQHSRVWITDDNHAVVLDFAAPGAPADVHLESADNVGRFLWSVANLGLSHAASTRLPLSASQWLEGLREGSISTAAEAARTCRELAQGPAEVTRSRRLAHLGIIAAPALVMLLIAAIAIPLTRTARASGANALQFYLYLLKETDEGRRPAFLDTKEHAALEVYVAGRFQRELMDAGSVASPFAPELRRFKPQADRLLATYPAPTENELATARAVLKDLIGAHENPVEVDLSWWEIAALVLAVQLIFTMLVALPSALVVRGGLVLGALGLTLVDSNGQPASRFRSFLRAVIAWSPVLAIAAIWTVFYATLFQSAGSSLDMSRTSTRIAFWLMDAPKEILTFGLAAIFFAGAAIALIRPDRGIQDVMAGTRLVPR